MDRYGETMDASEEIRQLRTENKKLARELKRLAMDHEILRIANEQGMRTQTYIQKNVSRQVFYNTQLLKTFPQCSSATTLIRKPSVPIAGPLDCVEVEVTSKAGE